MDIKALLGKVWDALSGYKMYLGVAGWAVTGLLGQAGIIPEPMGQAFQTFFLGVAGVGLIHKGEKLSRELNDV